jgi:hypothetical protein
MTKPGEQKQHVPVFVGSTYEDLKEYRGAARDALHRLETIVRGMEDFGSKTGTPKDECLKAVKSCKVYIGIFAMRYGFIEEESGKSMTHLEYDEAQRLGLPTLIYLIDEQNQPVLPKFIDTGDKAKLLQELKDELKRKHVVSFFTTPEDLAKRITQDLPPILGQSIGEQATDTVSGPLKFSSIRIDANDPNWDEGSRGGSPFDRPCSQYFKLVKFVCNADPLFDITLMNTGKSPVILTEIGIEVLTVCQRTYVYGFPTAAKIPKSDSYIIQIPNIKQRMPQPMPGNRGIFFGYEPQEVRETITKQLPDPIYLESNAPYRYALLLKNYYRHVPNWARIRMWAATDQGECRSAELETFTL